MTWRVGGERKGRMEGRSWEVGTSSRAAALGLGVGREIEGSGMGGRWGVGRSGRGEENWERGGMRFGKAWR